MRFINSLNRYVYDFFTKGHERSIAAKRNIAASLIIRGFSILISLLLVPLTINYVNPTQYGIWLTLSSIVTWASFFDIGFGHGLRNRFAESLAQNDQKLARNYVSTTYAALIIVFTVVWLAFFVANFFVNWPKILNAPSKMELELSTLAIIIFSFFCIQMVLKILSTILLADQKPALSGFLEMFGQFIALIIIYILTRTTDGSLIKLGLTIGLAPIIVLTVASVFFYRGRYRQFAPSIRSIDFSYARDILTLGTKFFLIQLSAIIIFQTTNIVITQVLGPEQVTVYNIGYKYFLSIGMVFTIILTPFWSAFTEAYAKYDFNWMRNSLSKLKSIWIYILPLVTIMLLISKYVYRIWIGESVVIPYSVSVYLTLYVIFFTRFNMFIYLINGIGKLQLQLYINFSISLIYIPMAVYSGKLFGLPGIILANIVIAIIHSIISQIQVTKLMNGTAKGIWNK